MGQDKRADHDKAAIVDHSDDADSQESGAGSRSAGRQLAPDPEIVAKVRKQLAATIRKQAVSNKFGWERGKDGSWEAPTNFEHVASLRKKRMLSDHQGEERKSSTHGNPALVEQSIADLGSNHLGYCYDTDRIVRQRTHYFTGSEAERHDVDVEDGKLVDARGQLVDTSAASGFGTHKSLGAGKHIYALNTEGQFRAVDPWAAATMDSQVVEFPRFMKSLQNLDYDRQVLRPERGESPGPDLEPEAPRDQRQIFDGQAFYQFFKHNLDKKIGPRPSSKKPEKLQTWKDKKKAEESKIPKWRKEWKKKSPNARMPYQMIVLQNQHKEETGKKLESYTAKKKVNDLLKKFKNYDYLITNGDVWRGAGYSQDDFNTQMDATTDEESRPEWNEEATAAAHPNTALMNNSQVWEARELEETDFSKFITQKFAKKPPTGWPELSPEEKTEKITNLWNQQATPETLPPNILPGESRPKALNWIHHSSLFAGDDVAGAGELSVDRGQVRQVSDNSGHYQPDNLLLFQAVGSLLEQGIAPEGLSAHMVRKGGLGSVVAPALEFLTYGGGKQAQERMSEERTARQPLLASIVDRLRSNPAAAPTGTEAEPSILQGLRHVPEAAIDDRSAPYISKDVSPSFLTHQERTQRYLEQNGGPAPRTAAQAAAENRGAGVKVSELRKMFSQPAATPRSEPVSEDRGSSSFVAARKDMLRKLGMPM